MLKTSITSKAANIVEQRQIEVSELRQRGLKARRDISKNRYFLLSQPSMLIWSFAAGAYLGAKRKKVNVVTPRTVNVKTTLPLIALLKAALSILALKRKAINLVAEDTAVESNTGGGTGAES